MVKLLEGLGVTFLVVTCVVVGSVAGWNLVHAEAQGTVPVERLAVRGSEIEKSVTRAVIDSLAVGPYPPEWDWYARRELSTMETPSSFESTARKTRACSAEFSGPSPSMRAGPRTSSRSDGSAGRLSGYDDWSSESAICAASRQNCRG